ncbi:actin binding protein, partial [Elasticomyces elasticus]
MATLNLSSNGPSITKSYQSIVNAAPATGAAALSPTYGQWAVYSVAAPLVSAFQQDSGKESVLKVQSTGEGELLDLIDEFSDGRIQFAFVRVKDPNTTLPKCVLVAWCGEGVPERTKGYFTSHLAAVSKLLHGYHVQVTARSDRDLTPEGIIQKVADSSGSKYSGGPPPPASNATGPPPPSSSKPAFMPTKVGSGNSSFNVLGSRSRTVTSQNQTTDNDGWGADAPELTRRQLEKVESAYQPTKVNMAELTAQRQEPSRFQPQQPQASNGTSDIVKGGYQPIGRVDLAAIRREAQQSGNTKDDRPTTVKGAYEPVGRVDITAIRAKAQGPSAASPLPSSQTLADGPNADEAPKSLADRSSAFTQSERLSSLPKPKVTNRFGSTTSNFTGTKAPSPGGFGTKPAAGAAPVGVASRTFADEGGKTPAQIWAEKKARQRGTSNAGETPSPGFGTPASPVQSQPSGGWSSGYAGKSWAPVQTTRTGGSDISAQRTGENELQQEAPNSPAGGVSAIRDRFKG